LKAVHILPSLESLLVEAQDHTRERGSSSVSLISLYCFIFRAVVIGKTFERQAIANALHQEPRPNKSREWQDGYDEAMRDVNGLLKERTHLFSLLASRLQ
jgi:hypothetical protein